jgi:nucleoside-diphosphate-sugar epimerase
MGGAVGPINTYNYVEEPVQTVAELIETLRAAGVRPARVISIPRPAALAVAHPVHALARLVGRDLKISPERVRKYAAHTWYDASLVRREGFRPAVALEHALQQTAAWHLGELRSGHGR